MQNPDELARLRADEGLLPGAVDELLRFVSPVQMTKPRFVVEDTVFEGCELRRGQVLMALLAAANSDPAVFDAPEMLDVGREKNRHVGLGAGPHFCLGAWLARKEMEVLLRCLLRRAPELGSGHTGGGAHVDEARRYAGAEGAAVTRVIVAD